MDDFTARAPHGITTTNRQRRGLRPMRLLLTLVGIGAALLGTHMLVLWAAPSAQDILSKIETVGSKVTYEGLRVLQVSRGGHVWIIKQKAYFAPGRRQRFEVVSPADQAGDIAVVDGQKQWRYSRCKREVYVSPLAPGFKGHSIPIGAARHPAAKWSVAGEANVAGRKGWVLVLKGPSGRQVAKLTVDRHKYVVLAAEHQRMRGAQTEKWWFESVKFDTHLSPTIFTFTPPSGTKVIQAPSVAKRLPIAEAERLLGMKALVPRYVPPGFTFMKDSVGVVRRGPHRVLWMMFRGVSGAFSIFQSWRLPEDVPQKGTIARWNAGPYTLVVMGDISRDEAEKIRKSLPPAPRR